MKTEMPTLKTNLKHRLGVRLVVARGGFTLIELLVVITVMVSLGGMLAYALSSATTDARIKRTQADVLTIGQLLQSRVNEVSLAQVSLVYGRSLLDLSRQGVAVPIPLSGAPISGPGTQAVQTAATPTRAQLLNFQASERARLILMARRDLARMVLPECQADLLYPPASLQFRTLGSSGWLPNVAQVKPPAQWSRMRTLAGLYSAGDIDAEYTVTNAGNNATSPASNPEFGAIAEAAVPAFEAILKHNTKVYWDPTSGQPRPQTTWTREHESSECLYLILATTELFGQTAIDRIPASQIEDTDQDGIPEILDSWGRPYAFVRNPIGFQNPGIKNFDLNGTTPLESFPIDPDPFDFLAADIRFDNNTHPTPYPAGLGETTYFPIYLPPAVISAGLDGEFGMRLSYVNTDSDPEPELGVNEGYSSSAVQYPVGAGAYGPVYPGVPVVRYPDPYFDVSTVPSDTPGLYQFSIASIAGAKTGGGLGAILDRDAAADNITSLDADF